MDAGDLEVIARVQAGDRDSFRLLVERYSRGLFRLAYRMTGNEEDAEDVVQEAFLRAYRQLHRYESRASFGTWLHRIAVNYSLDLLRGRKQEGDHGAPMPEIASRSPLPDRLVFAGEVQERLQEALTTLTPQERAAFLLRHFDGQSIQEIGGALELSENATKNSIFRAVQKLRRALEPLVSANSGGL